MIDDAELLAKRNAYLDTLRGLYRRERTAGFIAVLAGAALLIPARFVAGWPDVAIWAGYAMLAVGWAVMLYVIFRRTAWRRANPFNPSV